MNDLAPIRARALAALAPPPRLRLSEWIEANIVLPEGLSAQPGEVTLWPFQREIADAIGDPGIERVTIVKPVRVGFTTLLTSAIASYVANDPAPILALLPAEADCRDYVVSDVEPTFAASPAVAGALGEDMPEGDRNTLLSRRFPGGSLKVVAARAPRNLRRHSARVLFIDEADGMDPTAEGSAITLAERRTLSFPDRKIVLGSTPTHDDTSHVLRAWAQSDQRVFEVPCPECGAFAVIEWRSIVWDEGRPETARWRCPHCESEFPEAHKPAMVAAGCWRATAPEVAGHAGFRLNALVSLHENASWAKLATEFLGAKDDPAELQTFVNTILAQGWRGAGDDLDEASLAASAEPIGLDAIPEDVLALTAGCDVQHDRLEVTILGHGEGTAPVALAHRVLWGRYDEAATWAELDDLLRGTWPHPLGGRIGIGAAAIDAGDGHSMEAVMRFCAGRARRRIVAIKGMNGARPIIAQAQSKPRHGARLWVVGVDGLKSRLFDMLGRGAVRFSADLPASWYEQLVSERRVVRYSRGQPVARFERFPGREAEALDATVYAMAARAILPGEPQAWRDQLAGVGGQAPAVKLESDWIRR